MKKVVIELEGNLQDQRIFLFQISLTVMSLHRKDGDECFNRGFGNTGGEPGPLGCISGQQGTAYVTPLTVLP